jgi:ribosomal protein S18 acetylase RimI-like enzyme
LPQQPILAAPAPSSVDPGGEVVLRAAQPQHAGFQRELFAANAAAELGQIEMPRAMLDHLVAMQYRAQCSSYSARFPHARVFVIMLNDQPIGRLIEDDEPGCVHIVDIAFLPQMQGRGLGGTLLRARMAEWRTAGLGARSDVLATNTRSLRMHERLGFALAGPPMSAHLSLIWTPEPSRPNDETVGRDSVGGISAPVPGSMAC